MAEPTRPADGSSERRHAFRINDEVYLDYRLLPEDASADAESSNKDEITGVCRGLMQLRELTIQSGHILASIRKHNSEIAQYLAILDKKIDALAQMSATVGMGSDIRPSTEVNLSAGGLAFAQPDALQPGQRLALKLVLFPSHLCLQLVAKVIYCSAEHAEVEAGQHWTGVEFEPLPEHEQDALIRHLLEKQSAQLRKEREQE